MPHEATDTDSNVKPKLRRMIRLAGSIRDVARSALKRLAGVPAAIVERPGVAIPLAVLTGIVIALGTAHVALGACHNAMSREKDKSGRPGIALWGVIRVHAGDCRAMAKNPPWLQLAGLVASPAILLTWYWRDKKRRDDHQNALAQHAREVNKARDEHQRELEKAFSERYTRAAELVASDKEMTRINGLESLWDIAVQSKNHRAAISRTLAAFVRVRAKTPRRPEVAPDSDANAVPDAAHEVSNASPEAPAADTQTAMTLLGRDDWSRDDWKRDRSALDLRGSQLRDYDLGRAQLKDAHLSNVNLSGANLVEANLSGANLINASLLGANLSDANLSDANLTNANLVEARLFNANLSSANLFDANLQTANFLGANLANANLFDANLQTANFLGANLTGADLNNANLGAANLDCVDLTGAHLSCANLEGANLGGANLTGADLGGADLQSASLYRATLTGANLTNAKLGGAHLTGANLERADLHRADLRSANLSGANLEAAQLEDADLTNAVYDDETRFPASFGVNTESMRKMDQQ